MFIIIIIFWISNILLRVWCMGCIVCLKYSTTPAVRVLIKSHYILLHGISKHYHVGISTKYMWVTQVYYNKNILCTQSSIICYILRIFNPNQTLYYCIVLINRKAILSCPCPNIFIYEPLCRIYHINISKVQRTFSFKNKCNYNM